MIIIAKFASTCPVCSSPICAGSKVEWTRGEKAMHPACAGIVAAPASQAAPTSSTSRAVTVERVGRRSYLRGDTYQVRGMLRNAGCHWDAESRAWWIGSQETALQLAAKAATAPAESARLPAANRAAAGTAARAALASSREAASLATPARRAASTSTTADHVSHLSAPRTLISAPESLS